MKKYVLTAFIALLCLNFEVCTSAEAVGTAVETAAPVTAISQAAPIEISGPYEYEPSFKEGGLVPTVKAEGDGTSFSKEYIEEHAEEYVGEDGTFEGANEAVPAVREDGEPIAKYLDMAELYEDWCASGKYEYNYPDYVCGVWTETGDMSELVVAVTKDEAGEAGKAEILSLIRNDDSVKFTYQSYSYKELRQVQDEILTLIGDSSGIYALGVYEMENKLHADIDMSNPNADATVEKLLAQYGDMLVFEVGNGITLEATTEGFIDGAGGYDIGGAFGYTEETGGEILATLTEISVTGAKQDNTWIFAVCAAAVIALGGVIAFAVNKAKARQTTAGTLTEGGRLTASDTETIVKKAVEEPARDIFSAVMEEIDK